MIINTTVIIKESNVNCDSGISEGMGQLNDFIVHTTNISWNNDQDNEFSL